MKNIAIIGAGISGLTVAYYLKKQDVKITIFDKGRSVGGRMSSRRTNWGYLDHGTQFFSVKSPEFQEFLAQFSNIIQPWQGKFATWQNGQLIADKSQKIRYVPSQRMNNLCKVMANDLNVKLATRITSLEKKQKWALITENDEKYLDFDLIIITAPPLQTADLLSSHTSLTEEISKIEMLPCYSLMLIPEISIQLPFDGIQFEHPILGWISMNDSKPERANNSSLIIQSNFDWAIANLDKNREEIAEILIKTTSELFNLSLTNCKYQSVHLWRYALALKSSNQGYFWDKKSNIAVCGDWCLSGKVESAFLSAFLLVEELNKSI